jgi:hypothetical protein
LFTFDQSESVFAFEFLQSWLWQSVLGGGAVELRVSVRGEGVLSSAADGFGLIV